MRYPKGSLQLSPSRDLPILRQLLHSDFVTHSQLFEFMQLNHHERSRQSFDWRIKRLLDRELIRRQILPTAASEHIYSITGSAAEFLQSIGEYCLVGRDRFGGKEAERGVLHAIGLNGIQLSLLRAGLLVRWIGSTEVRSQNELTGFGFAKDYDAIVTARTEPGEQRFALEYERSPKTLKYYRDVATALNHEAHVKRVLYLVCNYDLLQFVSGFFRNAECRVLLGLERDWHTQLLDMPVSSSSGPHCRRLRETLDSSIEGASPKQAQPSLFV
jgi:hypothetical protein